MLGSPYLMNSAFIAFIPTFVSTNQSNMCLRAMREFIPGIPGIVGCGSRPDSAPPSRVKDGPILGARSKSTVFSCWEFLWTIGSPSSTTPAPPLYYTSVTRREKGEKEICC